MGAGVSCGPRGPRAPTPKLPYMASDATYECGTLLPQRESRRRYVAIVNQAGKLSVRHTKISSRNKNKTKEENNKTI